MLRHVLTALFPHGGDMSSGSSKEGVQRSRRLTFSRMRKRTSEEAS